MEHRLKPTTQTYLGDGLYVAFDGWQYRLYASDGERVTNQVFLDPDVLAGLVAFTKLIEGRKQQPEGNG